MNSTLATIIDIIKNILLFLFWSIFVYCIGIYTGAESSKADRTNREKIKELLELQVKKMQESKEEKKK